MLIVFENIGFTPKAHFVHYQSSPTFQSTMTGSEPMSEEILTRATAYWAAKRRLSRMPSRHAIDTVDLGALAPHAVISEAINQGRDYRHQLAGKVAEGLLVAKLTGAPPPGFSPEHGAMADWRNGLAVTRMFRAPHFAAFAANDGEGYIRAVYLPVSRQEMGETADFVLSVLVREADDAA